MVGVLEFTNAHITEYSYKAGEVAICMQEMQICMKLDHFAVRNDTNLHQLASVLVPDEKYLP